MGKHDELIRRLSADIEGDDRVSARLGDEAADALESQDALISDLVEALDAATIHMEVARGAIKSNQIDDKDVIGTLGRGIKKTRAALAKARETR